MKLTINGDITEQEKQNYIDYVQAKKPDRKLEMLEITIDGDYAELQYKFEEIPFERTRRITGYLVGASKKWNCAKLAELNDRVKHGVQTSLDDLK